MPDEYPSHHPTPDEHPPHPNPDQRPSPPISDLTHHALYRPATEPDPALRRLPPEPDAPAIIDWMRQLAQVAAVSIAALSHEAGLPTDAIMRAAMVPPETADAIMTGRSLPATDLVRIATALGTTVEALFSPLQFSPKDLAG